MVAAVKVLGGKIKVQGAANYLRVTWSPSALSDAEMREAVEALVFMSHREGRNALLMLTEGAEREQLDDRRFWAHIAESRQFQRIAALERDELVAIGIRPSGIGAKIPTRTFATELAARKWLRESSAAASNRATLLG